MNIPSVSVIIPLYNDEIYFHQCIDSVLSQSLKNIEIIIIDDASIDRSKSIADKYAKYDKRIKVIHKYEHIGVASARNLGIDAANGEFIAFMDSDDLYPSKDVLENLYINSIKYKTNICGGSLKYIDKDGNYIKRQLQKYQSFQNDGLYAYQEYQYDGGFYRFLYRNDFIKKNKLYFLKNIRREDCLFFVQAMHAAKYFYCMKKKVYLYRRYHKIKHIDKNFIYENLKARRIIAEFAIKNRYYILYNQQKRGFINDFYEKIKIKNISMRSMKIILILVVNFFIFNYKLGKELK